MLLAEWMARLWKEYGTGLAEKLANLDRRNYVGPF
jgi:hypothetical protein